MPMDLKFVIDNLEDLNIFPLEQSSTLFDQYNLIARDGKLSQVAIHKCEKILSHSPNKLFNSGIVRRFEDLWFVIFGENYPLVGFSIENLTLQQVDVNKYLKNRDEKLMQNLTIEEVEVTDYV